jgi:hypothetical protein
MYSNDKLFPDGVSGDSVSIAGSSLSTSSYRDFLNQYRDTGSSTVGLGYARNRIMTMNGFPFAVVFAFIVLIKLIRKIHFASTDYVLYVLKKIYKLLCGKSNKIVPNDRDEIHPYAIFKLKDELRQETAPFTGQYYSFLHNRDDIPTTCKDIFAYTHRIEISDEDAEDGWVKVDQDPYVVKSKIFTTNAIVGGVERPKGEFKRTFEVIADNGLNTYNLGEDCRL